MKRKYFGTDGVRGRVGQFPITPDFAVKLGLLFMTFPINLTFNILFFTNKKLKLTYIKSMNDISFIWDNMANSVYSSILSSTFLYSTGSEY